MRIRKRSLEDGWYPGDEEGVRAAVGDWERTLEEDPGRSAGAGVAPHAGWFFSGRLAWDTLRRARTDAETVIVAGGHRPPGSIPITAGEDAFQTPLGPVPADRDLAEALGFYVRLESDQWADNTVEVLLPLVRLRFPQAKVFWLRAPNDESAEGLGAAAARAAADLGRKVFFLASTDLTHYGPNYGFTPKGRGSEALEWVRDVNDAGFIAALLALDGREVIRRGNEDKAACSPGAAAAAVGFSRAMGYTNPRLCGYYTSHDVHPSESFVGYCSVVYE